MMKTWNLSSFEEVVPTVVTDVDRGASVEIRAARKRRLRVATQALSVAVAGTVVLAAVSMAVVRMPVWGNDSELRVYSTASVSNTATERPPLGLLFAVDHPLKWDIASESEMLERAASSLSAHNRNTNAINLVNSVLREGLPGDADEAEDLAHLGIKLG